MQDFSDNSDVVSPLWISTDSPMVDVVVGIEAYAIRNLENNPFPMTLQKDLRHEICDEICYGIDGIFETRDMVSELNIMERQYHWERFHIPYRLVAQPGGALLLLSSDESLTAIISGIDYVTLRLYSGNADFNWAVSELDVVLNRLNENHEWAFHNRYGYLSSNPAFCGNGFILSILSHLPGIVLANRMNELKKIINAHGLGIGGIWGGGIESVTPFIRIYTRKLIGKNKERLQEDVGIACNAIVELERESRNRLLETNELILKDKVYRAYGIAAYAGFLERWEFISILSSFRLGATLALLPLSVRSIDEMLILGQQAHIAKKYAQLSTPIEISEYRARFLRKKLSIN